MKPYNPSAKCEKCGSDKTDTTWHVTRGKNWCRDVCGFAAIDGDHMLRHCSNCGFEWLEAPMDVAQEPVAYPYGYAFGRYQQQGKGGPKVLQSILVGFRDITDEQAVEFAAKIEEMLAVAGFRPVNGKPKYMAENKPSWNGKTGIIWVSGFIEHTDRSTLPSRVYDIPYPAPSTYAVTFAVCFEKLPARFSIVAEYGITILSNVAPRQGYDCYGPDICVVHIFGGDSERPLIVFENFQLTQFNDRIPSITIEESK